MYIQIFIFAPGAQDGRVYMRRNITHAAFGQSKLALENESC